MEPYLLNNSRVISGRYGISWYWDFWIGNSGIGRDILGTTNLFRKWNDTPKLINYSNSWAFGCHFVEVARTDSWKELRAKEQRVSKLDDCLLRCCALWSSRSLPTFQALMMKAVGTSESTVSVCRTARGSRPQGSHLSRIWSSGWRHRWTCGHCNLGVQRSQGGATKYQKV